MSFQWRRSVHSGLDKQSGHSDRGLPQLQRIISESYLWVSVADVLACTPGSATGEACITLPALQSRLGWTVQQGVARACQRSSFETNCPGFADCGAGLTFSAWKESRPVVGSSAKSSRGLPMSSHPMLSRFFSPPDSPRVFASPTTVSAELVRPRRLRMSFTTS